VEDDDEFDARQSSSSPGEARRGPVSERTGSQKAGEGEREVAVPPPPPPVRRPSIFGCVALLAESSSSSAAASPSDDVRPPRGHTDTRTALRQDAFATPPYTPRSRSQPAAATPLAHHHRHHHRHQQVPRHADDLLTPPGAMTPGFQTYTPPFTPVRPATATPVGRPRSRLSLNCPSPLQDLTRPPSTSLSVVSILSTELTLSE